MNKEKEVSYQRQWDLEEQLKKSSKSENRTSIYIPDDLLHKLLESMDNQEKDVSSHIVARLTDSLSKRFNETVEQMDDKLALIKAASIKHKEMLLKLLEEEDKRLEEVYCTYYESTNDKVKGFAEKLKRSVLSAHEPLEELVTRMKSFKLLTESISTHRIDEIINTVEKLSNLSPSQIEILKSLPLNTEAK